MDFAGGVHLSEALSPPWFCLGWSSSFVGSESGQKHAKRLSPLVLSYNANCSLYVRLQVSWGTGVKVGTLLEKKFKFK